MLQIDALPLGYTVVLLFKLSCGCPRFELKWVARPAGLEPAPFRLEGGCPSIWTTDACLELEPEQGVEPRLRGSNPRVLAVTPHWLDLLKMVWAEGFEPPTFSLQTRRAARTALHPDEFGAPGRTCTYARLVKNQLLCY